MQFRLKLAVPGCPCVLQPGLNVAKLPVPVHHMLNRGDLQSGRLLCNVGNGQICAASDVAGIGLEFISD